MRVVGEWESEHGPLTEREIEAAERVQRRKRR